MTHRQTLWVLFFIAILTTNLGALLPNLRLCSPYFLPSGKIQSSFSSGISDFQRSVFLYEMLDLTYGVNENALLSVSLPILIYPEVESGMSFGDSTLLFQAVVVRSVDLTAQVMWHLAVRMATGVIQDDGIRRTGTKVVSFYPVSTGNTAIYPGVTARFLFFRWLLALSVEYQSVNQNGEDLFTFHLAGDRLAVKSVVDYYFKFNLPSEQELVLRPAFYLNALLNLSAQTEVSDSLIATAEFNFKIKRLFKLSLTFSQAILSKDSDLYRDLKLTLQKVF